MRGERFILIPGLGVDRRLFEPQWAHGLEFEVPPMLIPERHDTLTTYAARIRDALQLDGPCVVGGVSFGGMVACELGALCRARCVLLIASCRSRASIPTYYWYLERFARIVPDGIIRHRVAMSSRIMARMESLTQEQFLLIRDMATGIPIPFLRGAARMILSWDGVPSLPCPSYHIHGDIDRIIPLRKVRPDVVVPGGGHLINMTHADQVNRFIEEHLPTKVSG